MDRISKIRLQQLPAKIKLLLFFTVLNLTFGVSIGLYYVANTTQLSPAGTTEHFSGSEIDAEFDIPEKYPKPVSELLITTHNHILSLTLIFLVIGGIFYFNSSITGGLKTFLIAEPFVSILTTFGGIWLIRFVHPAFSYLVIISGILMYGCYFTMAGVLLYELGLKK
jgi:hypothetical protein